ncbi:4-hydroxyphenylpyruvate dioxygenase [Takifugu flavidus]|uniref:4-hydroxyphenylpyruvate dioxygenase n=1 Tax=Takifugu flavidus TaxID=433684 RepID=A0A5C6P2W2_9TELE|nr:4-hydroxyphenylpyruvate dioxygenase [Takifugu flavidus]
MWTPPTTDVCFIEYLGPYTGLFLPGYKEPLYKDPLLAKLPPAGLSFIDHIVGNQPDDQMVPVTDWWYRHKDQPDPDSPEAPHQGTEPPNHPGQGRQWDSTSSGRPETSPSLAGPHEETP